MTETIQIERDGPIVEITIDRPTANAIDGSTSRALGEVFASLDADPEVRVAILTGAGTRFFSAGWDLGAAASGESFDEDWGVGGFGGFPDLPDRRTPVIAAVNGLAVGGGFEIAMAADLIVAADHADFFLSEVRLGMLPDAGSIRLPRMLPRHIARELLLTSRRMGAAEAARWGLVNRVVPHNELKVVTRAMAAEIVAAAPLSIAALLDIERRTAHLSIAEAMQVLPRLASYRAAIDSADAQEGPRAFTERRPPTWLGR
ncbi:MAG: enoyl-CoA hydratase-related protein [Acidimicrobiia bacterium]